MKKLNTAASSGRIEEIRMISRYPCNRSNAAPKMIGPIAEPTTLSAAITPRIPPRYHLPNRFGLSTHTHIMISAPPMPAKTA